MLPDLASLKQQFMLTQLFNGGIETLLNGLLSRSEDYHRYLRKLNGKVLLIHLSRFDVQHYLVFSQRHIDILAEYTGAVDCDVTLSPELLFHFPKKAQLTQYINNKSIILNGDVQVLQDFIGLIEGLEKDPAELLSPYVGDVIAQSAVDFGRKLTETVKHKTTQSQRYWGERLTEEYQLIAPTLAIADFCDQVKTLEKQTALLEQKINKLTDETEKSRPLV